MLPTTLLLAIKWRFSHLSPNTTEVIAVIDSRLSSEVARSAADLNIEDKDGWTPLHHAARNNAVNAIEFLLENGVEDARPNKQKEAPVHVTVIYSQLNALKVLENASTDSFEDLLKQLHQEHVRQIVLARSTRTREPFKWYCGSSKTSGQDAQVTE